MGAVRVRTGELLRRRVWATVLLAVLVGLAGGIVLAATAGARRNDAALADFLAEQRHPHAAVFIGGEAEGGEASPDRGEEAALLRALPYVDGAYRAGAVLVSVDAGGERRAELASATLDPGGLALWGTPIVRDGRLPDDAAADEAAIDEELAQRRDLSVGDRLTVGVYGPDQLADGLAGTGEPAKGEVDIEVVGIVRYPHDVIPVRAGEEHVYSGRADLYLSPALFQRIGSDVATFGIATAVHLRGGAADIERLAADVRAQLGEVTFVEPVDPVGGVLRTDFGGVRRAIDLETSALQAFAALAALAGLVLAAQAVSRQLAAEGADHQALRAIGMTRGQLVAVALLRTAVVATIGAVLAIGVAVALSPLTPIGLARRAELDPGLSVDWAVLLAGALAVVVVLCVIGALAGLRAGRRADGARDARESTRLASTLAAAKLGPPAVSGITLALRRGAASASVPIWTAVAGASLAVAAVVGATTFDESLDGLLADPPAFGVTWDVSVGNLTTPEEAAAAVERLAGDPAVDAFTGVSSEAVTVDGELAPLVLLFEEEGWVTPRVVDGQAPRGADEIALGAGTLDAIGAEVGDEVTVAYQDFEPQRFRVSASMVLNSAGVDDSVTLGEGAVVGLDGHRRLAGELADLAYPQSFLVQFRAGADRAAALAALERDFPRAVVPPLTGSEIDNVERVSGLPLLLAGLVAVLGLGATAHAMVLAVRRRRGELAVLKALGFVRRQLSATVAWQATTFVTVALLVGVPLGLVVGRWGWRLTAGALHVVSGPELAPATLAATVLLALVVVNLVALVPAWLARRLSPATVLRTE